MAIGIIVAIVLIGAMIGCIIGAANANTDVGQVLLGIIAAACFIAFIIVPFSFHTVQAGEIAVVKHLGEINQVRTAGTYYDFWITNNYVKYDAKVQNVDVTTMAYSSDAQTMDIQMTLQYSIMGDNVKDIATQYGTLEVLQNRIISIATEKAKSVLSSYKAMDIIAQRASISPAVETAIKAAIGDEYFVNVATVVLTNIDFSDAFEAAVEDKMIAEQAKLKADYDNQTKVAKAEADAEAKLKAAQAEIEIAKAEAEALTIAAEAQAEANRKIAESLTDEIIQKMYYETWDGKLPTVIGDGDYILPSNIIG